MGTGVGGISDRMARPSPPGSGSWYTAPSYSRRWPLVTARMISIVSRVRRTGWSKRTPCQPSITCGPLAPTPSTNRPSERACIDSADMASMAGVRAPSWTMPVASRIVDVCPAR